MHPVLAGLAAAQGGVFTAEQARRAGYTGDEIRRLRTSGRWVTLRRGAYAEAERVDAASAPAAAHRLHVAAARLTLSNAAGASHQSAALLLGLPLLDQPGSRVTVTIDRPGTTRCYANLVVHRAAV